MNKNNINAQKELGQTSRKKELEQKIKIIKITQNLLFAFNKYSHKNSPLMILYKPILSNLKRNRKFSQKHNFCEKTIYIVREQKIWAA